MFAGVKGFFKSVSAVATDAYFNLVTLLLPGNGTNGAQNNTFLDSSSNNFTITRNGNTTQGTFSPFSQTGWSNFFDGTGDYLTSTVSSVGSSGDLTVEGWVYPTISGVRRTFFFIGGTGTFDLNLFTEITAGNVLRLLIRNDSVIDILDISSTTTVSTNTWSHVAFVLSGTSATIYLNGTSVATGTLSGTRTGTFTTGSIGALLSGGATHYFNGYISNLRYVKGTAVYTAAFTPPTAPLTAITNTSLLTCQSNRFIDNSSNAYTITRNGDTSVQAFSPFAPTAAYSAATNGGSGYFDGSGDYLTAGAVTDWVFLNRFNVDFTISFWLFHPSASTPYGIISTGWNTTEVGFNIVVNNSGNNIITTFFNRGVSGSAASFDSSANLVPNAWNYVTITYTTSSKTVAFYINGAASGSGSNTGFAYSSSNPAFTLNVGRSIGGTAGSINNLNGYLSGLRILNGSIGSTTLPTEPPTNITNTSILLNFTNAGITDATAKNDLETVGNAQISTTQSKFGGSSMYFDGTGDRLVAPTSQNTAFRTGDFTIEFWAYPTSSTSTFRSFIDTRSGSVNTGISIWQNGTSLEIYGSAQQLAATSALTVNAWQHIAVTRASNTVRAFVNGTQVGSSYTNSNDMTDTRLVIADDNTSTYPFVGYLDDFRITKGYARYTANFSAPTAAFPLS